MNNMNNKIILLLSICICTFNAIGLSQEAVEGDYLTAIFGGKESDHFYVMPSSREPYYKHDGWYMNSAYHDPATLMNDLGITLSDGNYFTGRLMYIPDALPVYTTQWDASNPRVATGVKFTPYFVSLADLSHNSSSNAPVIKLNFSKIENSQTMRVSWSID